MMSMLFSRGAIRFRCLDYSGKSARKRAVSVKQWFDDPSQPGRQFGWVTEAPKVYVRPVVRIAVRCRKANGEFAVGVLISALSAETVLALTQQPPSSLSDPAKVLLAYVRFYEERRWWCRNVFQGRQAGIGPDQAEQKAFRCEANSRPVGEFGSQCRCLGTTMAQPSVYQIARLWDIAHGS